MSENLGEQSHERLVFVKSIPEASKAPYLKAIPARQLSSWEPGEEKRWLFETKESVEFESLMNKAIEKFSVCGMEIPESSLPSETDFQFINLPEGKGVNDIIGVAHLRNIEIHLPRQLPITDPRAQKTIYHELAHFITQHVLDNRGEIAAGFDRIESGKLFGTSKGLYGEALAELFAMFCVDDENLSFATPYGNELIFMDCLIQDFSQKKGIAPLEGFKHFFKANTQRDFGLQKELVEIYGKEFVKSINSVVSYHGLGYGKPKESFFEKIAESGDFKDSFNSLKADYDQHKIIHFPGIKGGFIKPPELIVT